MRKLARQRVEIAHALDRHQKRLVGGKAGGDEGCNLLAQVVFQFRNVNGVDRLAAAQITAPLVNLRFERCHVIQGRHGQAPCGSSAADAG